MGLNRPVSILVALVLMGAAEISFAFQLKNAPAAGPAETVPVGGEARKVSTPTESFLARRSLTGASARLRIQARQQNAALPILQPQTSSSQVNTWQPIGPNQVLTPRFGKVTGRVTSLAIDTWDKSGNTVYAGTTGGGSGNRPTRQQAPIRRFSVHLPTICRFSA